MLTSKTGLTLFFSVLSIAWLTSLCPLQQASAECVLQWGLDIQTLQLLVPPYPLPQENKGRL